MVKQRERWIICSSGQGWRLPAVAFDAVQNAVLSQRAVQTAVNSIYCTAPSCIALHWEHCTAVCCIAFDCITLHCAVLHYIALQYTALTGSTAMHTAAVTHFIALYHLSLPYLSNHSANVKPSKTYRAMHNIKFYCIKWVLCFTACSAILHQSNRESVHCCALHCDSPNCNAPHCTAPHCFILPWNDPFTLDLGPKWPQCPKWPGSAATTGRY